MKDYIRTYTGRKFHTDPRPEDVKIEDIAVGLSRAPRWSGHTLWKYPVAAHSLYVAALLPAEYKLQGLIHDASETYMADIPSPFKVLLPDYKKLEEKIMVAVTTALNIPWPMAPLVKAADGVALFTERVKLFRHPVADDVEQKLARDFVGLDDRFEWNWQIWAGAPEDRVAEFFYDEFKRLQTGVEKSSLIIV